MILASDLPQVLPPPWGTRGQMDSLDSQWEATAWTFSSLEMDAALQS